MKPRAIIIATIFLCSIAAPFFQGISHATDEGGAIILTAEEIGAMKALKISDVLNNVPGVKAGNSSVSIHGSYKVKVFVDGRPINDPTSSHGGINWDFVSPDDVETIEVLRGKGGLTYGQDASGGVILVTTKSHRRFSGNVKAYGGNHGVLDVTAALNTTAGNVAMGISGGYETTDGYKINNDKKRRQGGLKLSYAPEEKSPVIFSMDHLRDKRGSSGLPDYPTPYARKETRNTVYALQTTILGLSSSTHYNDGYRHNMDPSRDLDRSLKVRKFGQDLTGTFDTLAENDLACGLALTWDRASGTGFEDQEEHSFSLFASQSLSWPQYDLTLTTGVRGNYHSNFSNTANPEAKLVYKKTAWRLAATYSQTDNLPSFYQRYNQTSSTRPNPNLDMEQARNLNLSLFTTPHPDLSLSMSVFYNRLKDRITYLTADDGMGEYQNFGKVSYTGGDAAVGWQVHDAVKIKTSYTYMVAEDRETGLRLPGKPEHIVSLDVYWQPTDTLSLVATGKHVSKVFRNKSNTKTVPAYTTLDLRAEQAFGRVSIFGEIENLTDEDYCYADGLLAAPLAWVVGINWQI
jgi:iron complex outermembrane receptor protein